MKTNRPKRLEPFQRRQVHYIKRDAVVPVAPRPAGRELFGTNSPVETEKRGHGLLERLRGRAALEKLGYAGKRVFSGVWPIDLPNRQRAYSLLSPLVLLARGHRNCQTHQNDDCE